MQPTTSITQALIKLFAIIGLFSLIALGIWLIVQGIRVFPSAFSSLASIAETVERYRPVPELAIELEKNIVNSGESFTVQWTDMGEDGTYIFKHTCTPGAFLSVRTSNGLLQEIPCTESLTLPENVHGIFLTITTKEQQFSEIPVTITFNGTNGDDHVSEHKITVVNASIPTKPETTITTKPHYEPELPVAPSEKEIVQTSEVKEVTPDPKPKEKIITQPAATVVAIQPKSYEHGFIDLRVSFVAIGITNDGIFTPKATFNQNDVAAFRFEVKNIGTKTSKDWSYTLTLPGGLEYVSDVQTGLAPNERALYTIAFNMNNVKTPVASVEGSLSLQNDVNLKNNTFSWSVKVTE